MIETRPSMEVKLLQAFPDITIYAMAEFRKIARGDTNIDGKSMGNLGLVYRSNWKHNQWSLTSEGLRFARFD